MWDDAGFIVEGVKAGFSMIYCPLQWYLPTPGSWQARLLCLHSDILLCSLIIDVSGSPVRAAGFVSISIIELSLRGLLLSYKHLVQTETWSTAVNWSCNALRKIRKKKVWLFNASIKRRSLIYEIFSLLESMKWFWPRAIWWYIRISWNRK